MGCSRVPGSSYDVFLSFRGEDTRHSFTDHLYNSLKQAGDNDDAEREPSDARKQQGTFKIAPNSSGRWTDDNVKRWKAALTEVADVIGMRPVGSETAFLKEVVGTIYSRLDRRHIYIPPNLTGMDIREKEIDTWLKESEAEYLVISGMAGSGKSTLAQYIVYSNGQNFESVSILEQIGSKCKEQKDMVKLQEQLCIDLIKGKDRRIPSVCQGTPQIEVLLGKRKALIVLDDIVRESQLEDLLGTGNVNKKSKIIITSVDNGICNWFKSKSKRCKAYNIKLLNDDESLELLSLHAFGSKSPKDGFQELAQQVVRYCEGNPLALKMLGSSLSKDNSIASWESALNLFGKDFHGDIFDVLKRSYDSLPYESDKQLFLHIACIFVGGDVDDVVKILEPDYSAISGIKTLIRRCFVYVTPNNKLMMHRLLQEMGRSLVDRESCTPAERSRLWRNKESYNMLRRGKSSQVMKGLTLDMDMLMEEDEFKNRQLKELSTDSLQQMDQLELLRLNFVNDVSGSYDDVSKKIRWLCWFGFNKSTIPSDLFMGNMVALDLSYSFLKEFKPPMVLKSLKILSFKDL